MQRRLILITYDALLSTICKRTSHIRGVHHHFGDKRDGEISWPSGVQIVGSMARGSHWLTESKATGMMRLAPSFRIDNLPSSLVKIGEGGRDAFGVWGRRSLVRVNARNSTGMGCHDLLGP
jgi:hypothetical protein